MLAVGNFVVCSYDYLAASIHYLNVLIRAQSKQTKSVKLKFQAILTKIEFENKF